MKMLQEGRQGWRGRTKRIIEVNILPSDLPNVASPHNLAAIRPIGHFESISQRLMINCKHDVTDLHPTPSSRPMHSRYYKLHRLMVSTPNPTAAAATVLHVLIVVSATEANFDSYKFIQE